MNILPADDGIAQAIDQLEKGKVIALPTDTFYGLAVDAQNEEALKALTKIKGREKSKFFPLMLGDESWLPDYASSISEAAKLLIKKFWPGRLTLILPGKNLPTSLQNEFSGIGFRVPNLVFLTDFLARFGRPITGTSANRSGELPATTINDVQRSFSNEEMLVLDGGKTEGGLPSTVIDLTGAPKLIREGAIPWSEIQAAWRTS